MWEDFNPEQTRIFIALLLMANHKDGRCFVNGEVVSIKSGQFYTSVNSIIAKCKCKSITAQKVRTALKKFEKYGFLTTETTKQGTLVTIVNWGIYQDCNEEDNKQSNKDLTNEQQRLNKDLTNEQQRPNKDLTTNKNVKNIENDKNDKNIAAVRETTAAAETSAIRHYINNINPTASPIEVEKLAIWVKELDRESKGDDVVICAIDDAVMCNHRNLKYIERILDRCEKQGIYTAGAFAAQKERFMAQKKAKSTGGAKVNTFTDYEQRQYDYDELERLLAKKEKERMWIEDDG
jgi:DnaD/phage-associated family protein